MNAIDFHRSFFYWETDRDAQPLKTVSDLRQNKHSRSRHLIGCRCNIRWPSGKSVDYFLGAACKSERCGCSKEVGLFMQPNADFLPVYSRDEDMVFFKSWDRNNKGVMLVPASLGPQPERQVIKTKEAFSRHRLQVRRVPATELKQVDQIIAASDAGMPLVARTEFQRAGFRILLEYPVFTFNVSPSHRFYQTDTGPVIFPELKKGTGRVGGTFRLAFAAFNSPDWVEFIVQKPTPIGKGLSVNHYSESVQLECKNSIYAAR